MIIESGDHHGRRMIVDANGRAMTNAITQPHITNDAEAGNAFFFMSDFVALTTTGTYTGLIYIKNNYKCGLNNYATLLMNPQRNHNCRKMKGV